MNKHLSAFLILIVLSSAAFSQASNTLTRKEKKKGWTMLFDGISTQGWTTTRGEPVPEKGWEVNNGVLSTIKGAKGGDIITVNQYSDFDLTLEYKIEPACNSGVKYFFTRYETGGNLGMEFQILDDILAEDNKLENHLCGSFYDVLAPDASKKKINPPGEWNSIRIVSKGKKAEHWINGKRILSFTRGDKAFTEGVAKSKFSKTVPAFGMVDKGSILLQEHGGLVSFRNIKIRELNK